MIRLLLVEDDPNDRELVRRGFRDTRALSEPVEITAVETVDAALALLERESFTVIVLDYSLPGRTGLDLLHALRTSGNTTPVVMLTGAADTMVAVTALQDGAADFVIKDIGFERALGVAVQRTIEKHAATDDGAAADPHPDFRTQLEHRLDVQSRQLRRALQESEALRHVAHTLATARELAEALTLVSRTTAQLLQSHAAAVLLTHGTDYVLVSSWGPVKLATGVKRADLLDLLAADCADVATATMHEEGDPIGVLWVGRSCHGPFVPTETELLEALSDLTALSIAKLRAREQVRRLREAAATPPAPEPAPPADAPTASAAPTANGSSGVPSGASSREDALARDVGDPNVVLVVDDSEKVLAQARAALETSMTVLTATSGKLALETYAARRPGLVVIDLVMPEMDGFATLAELQRLGADAPCIALALRGDAAAQELARKAGYVAVVEKPLRNGELVTQISHVLATPDQGSDDHFEDDDGHPVLVLPNPAANLARVLPQLGRHIRVLAEQGCDTLILDAANFTDITPEHVTMLARLYAETSTVGMRTAIATANARVVQKLRDIVDIRDARYVASRDEAKQLLQ